MNLNDSEFIDMKKELSDLSINFSKDMNEENTSFEFTKEQLNGMPDSWFEGKDCLENGKYTENG